MIANPKYDVDAIVYFREAAAIGSLEAVRISGVHRNNFGWVYSISTTLSPPSPGVFLDRRSHVNTEILFFSEDEFVDYCGALELAEDKAKRHLDYVQAQKNLHCPSSPTEGNAGTGFTGDIFNDEQI